jgi:hypothetical protein
MGAFQVLWVYYGLLILSRPVIAWNVVAVLINFLSVGAYFHFVGKEKPNRRGCLGVDADGQLLKYRHGAHWGSVMADFASL